MKKSKVFLRVFILACAILMVFSTFAMTAPLKVALILPHAITSEGWTKSGFDGLMKAKEDFDIETSYQESVSEGELKGALRSYVAEGYDLIVVHEMGYNDPTIEVAEESPDTMFAITYGFKAADNVAVTSGTNWQANSLAGAVAGLMTKSNKVGFIISNDSPVAHNFLNAGFIYGARRINPEVKVFTTFVGSWTDVVKGKELAKAMIKQGVDVIYSQCGVVNRAVIEVCEEAGIWAVGAVEDMSYVATEYLVYGVIKEMVDGTLKGGRVVKGIKDGAEEITFNPLLKDKLPENGEEKIMALRQEIVDGDITLEQMQEELTKQNVKY
jgi:basic membrane protein A